jgi:hypothetical protein
VRTIILTIIVIMDKETQQEEFSNAVLFPFLFLDCQPVISMIHQEKKRTEPFDNYFTFIVEEGECLDFSETS